MQLPRHVWSVSTWRLCCRQRWIISLASNTDIISLASNTDNIISLASNTDITFWQTSDDKEITYYAVLACSDSGIRDRCHNCERVPARPHRCRSVAASDRLLVASLGNIRGLESNEMTNSRESNNRWEFSLINLLSTLLELISISDGGEKGLDSLVPLGDWREPSESVRRLLDFEEDLPLDDFKSPLRLFISST